MAVAGRSTLIVFKRLTPEGKYMLKWNECDFLECLEVESFFEDDDQSYEFNVHGDAVNLQVKVLPEKDAIGIKLISRKTSENYFSSYYAVLGPISCENETLFIDNCIPIGEHEPFGVRDLPDNYRFRLEIQIKPEIYFRTILK